MTEISITEIQIVPIQAQNGLVAFASFVINDVLYIGNVAIYTSPARPSGFRLVYPAKKLGNGTNVKSVRPISAHVDNAIEKAIIGEYKRVMLNLEAP